MTAEGPHAQALDDPGTNLASQRTALALERTWMASERTLMAVMWTALALIGFGFTIYQFLIKFAPETPHAVHTARNFGISLIVLGIGTVVAGPVSQFRSLAQLRERCNSLYALGLLHHGLDFRPTPVVAGLLLLLGLVAILGIAFRVGPFG